MRRSILLATVILSATLATAGTVAAHENDLDPRDGDVHVHEGEGIGGIYGGEVGAHANVTCTTATPSEPCTVERDATAESPDPKGICFFGGSYCLL